MEKSLIEIVEKKKVKAIPVNIKDVKIDGFWGKIIERNRKVSIPLLYKLFVKNKTIENFEIEGGIKKGEKTRRLATDSDLYKWIEGVSWDLQNEWNEKNVKIVEDLIELIGKAQKKSGYLNTSPYIKKEFENLKYSHELYCGGHLIQAAIAYYRSTGKENLLNIAIKWADFIFKKFGKGKIEKTDGHPEVEMALVELYRTTKNEKYLNLAEFFLEVENPDYCGLPNIPILKFKQLFGHTVRMLYLCSGATDYYTETGDRKYLKVLENLWEDLVKRKIYITGGIGSRYEGEAIGYPYELPNLRAYCESCASVAGMMWCFRMFLIKGESEYFDIFEQILYNSFLASISFDGKKYFYVNPLSSIGNYERKEWYSTTCCPPNIQRFISSLPGYFYATSNDGIYVNLYDTSTAEINLNNKRVKIEQKTNYPWKGKILMNVQSEGEINLYLRIPKWSEKTEIKIDKKRYRPESGKYFKLRIEKKKSIEINFNIRVDFYSGNPEIESVRNCVSIKRGPIVYCLENIDNPKINLFNSILYEQKIEEKFENMFGGFVSVNGKILTSNQKLPLYEKTKNLKIDYIKKKFKAIPYYLWANRGKSEMNIWFLKK
ncbi:MAG: glycoside hydrolase family 127 protein [Candidatus Omnitrophica bacterium]|nr:glycoside hydrolase family 127 protein [Candidatus Omnitrophota bacterium]MCM8802875.1 glycoside hydrolase family 127 protein [Candidatus Omnitrophota bacterium]